MVNSRLLKYFWQIDSLRTEHHLLSASIILQKFPPFAIALYHYDAYSVSRFGNMNIIYLATISNQHNLLVIFLD